MAKSLIIYYSRKDENPAHAFGILRLRFYFPSSRLALEHDDGNVF